MSLQLMKVAGNDNGPNHTRKNEEGHWNFNDICPGVEYCLFEDMKGEVDREK